TSGTATLVNSTISHNTALYQDMASGIGARGGTLSLLNCTLAYNSGGVAGLYNDSSGSTNVRNSIIAENTTANCAGSFVSGGYNLDSDGSCGFNSKGDLVAAPLLGPLQNNGGQTETHALLTGSPAIDHIPIKACGVRTDQRGVARPIDGNEDGLLACDVGAYELNP
ncbi:MAG: choice-of-anchor Q domain-containing protein, partial [Chloroflexota bacterium]